jgi:hypothetical protein
LGATGWKMGAMFLTTEPAIVTVDAPFAIPDGVNQPKLIAIDQNGNRQAFGIGGDVNVAMVDFWNGIATFRIDPAVFASISPLMPGAISFFCAQTLGTQLRGSPVTIQWGGNIVRIMASLENSASKIGLIEDLTQQLAALLGCSLGGTGFSFRIGYDSGTGLLTLKKLTADKFRVSVTDAASFTFKVNGTSFTGNFNTDLDALIAALRADSHVSDVQVDKFDNATGTIDIQGQPGPGLAVTDLTTTTGSGLISQTQTSALTAIAWVQFYADAACTTPQNGPMGSALGKVRLPVAP